jgi:hypothetical protein
MKRMHLNEKGSVLNVALLIIIMLSLIGLGLNRVVTLDNKIGINVKRFWGKFYEAEGVLREAAQWLEDTDKDVLEAKALPGLYNEVHLMDVGQNYDSTLLGGNVDGEIDEDEMANALELPLRADIGAANYSATGWPDSAWLDPEGDSRNFITIDYGIALGTSLVMNDPSRMHQFIVAGRAQNTGSNTIIKAGYLKRF